MVRGRGGALVVAALVLVAIGSAVRLAALLSPARTIAAFSEDGYLMLTVARNISKGLGLTIADGTIATNGIQPLVTFLWAATHWLFDAQRLPTLRALVVLQWVLAALTAVLVVRLARRTFAGHPAGAAGSMLAGGLWFASPLALRHTTNGLETGAYALGIAAILSLDPCRQARSAWWALALGGALGVLFLVRNDAVFFIAAWLLVEMHTARGGWDGGARRLVEALRYPIISALSALAVASPWLLYNVVLFGHPVPVSGRAQNLDAPLGENLAALPGSLAEYAWFVTPLPLLDSGVLVAGLSAVALAVLIVLTVRRARRIGMRFERWMTVLLAHGSLLAVYYALFFGAAYFLSRYLFPLSLLSVLLPLVWVLPSSDEGGQKGVLRRTMPSAIAVCIVALVTLSAVRFHLRKDVHPHGHVVEWVTDHLSEDTWVGAPQSGTLGYFHDRTINLDGKVNPFALRARLEDRLFQYVVEETPIEYIADWYGLARWIDRPESVQEENDPRVMLRHFAVVVRDPDRNLVVFKRILPGARGSQEP